MQATMAASGGNNIGRFLLLVLVVVAGGLAFMTLANVQGEQTEAEYGASIIAALPDIEITGDHADKKHPEAPHVRRTCKDNGVYQVWREKYDPSTYHLLCMDDAGKMVDWIVRKVTGGYVEATAFMPRAGVAAEVIKYVASKATRYKGGW